MRLASAEQIWIWLAKKTGINESSSIPLNSFPSGPLHPLLPRNVIHHPRHSGDGSGFAVCRHCPN